MDGMRLGEDLESYFILRCRGNREKNKGNEWSDGMGGQVKQICIWYDDLIYGIQVSYERNGNIFHSPRHGGNEGNFEQILLNEPITCVRGHYGSWTWTDDNFPYVENAPYVNTVLIKSLTFETGKATHGPFGKEIGIPFRFKMATGCAGFHGRSSSDKDHGVLLAVGIYVRSSTIKPTSDVFSHIIAPVPSVIHANEDNE
ncbi:jacalin-related lectin 19-like [Dioscorea cayenensis subsp. rotundata]|uniref:Jacalin-related lectin 19-like n=1 Tax=Dioscorea cayennensis subsp. rotundata TaxID=55577 RepID=A0AB40BVD2_DIOCR|nr:jacalin-related lectin 19-like [Dioscorea cayenensis subsp. rotundata]